MATMEEMRNLCLFAIGREKQYVQYQIEKHESMSDIEGHELCLVNIRIETELIRIAEHYLEQWLEDRIYELDPNILTLPDHVKMSGFEAAIVSHAMLHLAERPQYSGEDILRSLAEFQFNMAYWKAFSKVLYS